MQHHKKYPNRKTEIWLETNIISMIDIKKYTDTQYTPYALL